MYSCKHCQKQFSTGRGLGGHTFRVHTQKGKDATLKGIEAASIVNKGNKYTLGFKHSKETKEKLSEIRVNSLNENAFYSKRSLYKNVTLDSSYELKVAKSLDENNIKWIRPKSLKWNDNGQIRRYIPDFYLPDFDVYLDPKNDFLIKKDTRKINLTKEYNSVNIIILDKDNLEWPNIKKLVL